MNAILRKPPKLIAVSSNREKTLRLSLRFLVPARKPWRLRHTAPAAEQTSYANHAGSSRSHQPPEQRP